MVAQAFVLLMDDGIAGGVDEDPGSIMLVGSMVLEPADAACLLHALNGNVAHGAALTNTRQQIDWRQLDDFYGRRSSVEAN